MLICGLFYFSCDGVAGSCDGENMNLAQNDKPPLFSDCMELTTCKKSKIQLVGWQRSLPSDVYTCPKESLKAKISPLSGHSFSLLIHFSVELVAVVSSWSIQLEHWYPACNFFGPSTCISFYSRGGLI